MAVAPFEMAAALAQNIVDQPKFCAAALHFQQKPNQGNLLIATCALEDDTGATLPGLTLQLEIRRPLIVDRWQFEFGLFLLQDGHRKRVYQLHSSPSDKRSHNAKDGPLYGPHEHIGDSVTAVVLTDSADPASVFALYCKRINLIYTGKIEFPL